jgi:hypothetical protein
MRRSILLTCFLLTMAASARSSWEPYGAYAATDLWDAHRGLVCTLAPEGRVEIMQDSIFRPVLETPVSQIAIQDADRAWAVEHDTLYAGTNSWTSWKVSLVDSVLLDTTLVPAPLTLVRATPNAVFLYTWGMLYWTVAGDTLIQAQGIERGDSIFAIDYFSATTLVAITQSSIYVSTDGGANWTGSTLLTSNVAASVYVDTAHHLIYIGGDVVRVSADTGKTWSVVEPPPEFGFLNFGGQVFGAHDCSGTFYISKGSRNGTNTDIMRSTDQGRTFFDLAQMPGPYFNYTGGVRAWVFDRGATVYWDAISPFTGETLYFTRDGIDGVVSDSVESAIMVTAENVFDTLCSESSVPVTVSIASSICTGISVDSITVVRAVGSIPSRNVSETFIGTTITALMHYSGNIPGYDSVMVRLWYHGLVWNFEEHTDFSFIAYSISPPAVLIAPDSIDFGSVQLGRTSGRELTIANEGCSPLRIDSLVSSDPAEFNIGPTQFPFFVDRDTSIAIYVSFFPRHSGLSVESYELGTSAGHRFIEISGSGYSNFNTVAATDTVSKVRIVPNPAVDELFVRDIEFPARYIISDLLGRARQSGTLKDGLLRISLPDGSYYFECGQQVVRFIVSKP